MYVTIFFFNQQNFIKNQVSTQDGHRSVLKKVQTKDVVYRWNTRKTKPNKDTSAINTHKDNTHQNKHHLLKVTPILTNHWKNDIHNTHRHYSPQRNTLVKEKTVLITNTKSQPKNFFSKDHSASTTANLRSIERTPKKPNIKLEPKN